MNEYYITLKKVQQAGGQNIQDATIQLNFEMHDELFDIIERIKEKNIFENPSSATEFAIGVKLFSEVMIQNRNNPLFSEFLPHFKSFMQKLKKHNSDSSAAAKH